jgi:hypothetical protein
LSLKCDEKKSPKASKLEPISPTLAHTVGTQMFFLFNPMCL